jgi:hypothetical protein
MTRTKQPFRDFDLPVKHLMEGMHWVPPKARDEAEIARRRAMRKGGVLADFQYRGMHVAAKVLEFVAAQEPDEFLIKTLSATEYNTAWYNYGRGATEVMRRRLKLPRHDENPQDLKPEIQQAEARDDLVVMDLDAKFLIRHPGMPRQAKNLGIGLGDSSLRLASVSVLPDLRAAERDPNLVEEITRHTCMEMVEDSRYMHREVHANPALAQLADPNSPLSHYWRVSGSNFAVDALEYATYVAPQPPIAA